MTRTAHHKEKGDIALLRSPINLSAFVLGTAFHHPGPDIGEHSRELLEEFAFSPLEIEELVRSGAVV